MKSFKKQGNAAEKSVSEILRSLGNEYRVYDNVMLKTSKGTTQIDHVVVSKYGIFVIETKSHKGKIFGDCFGKNWTQVLYSKQGMQKYPFYSPYIQNFGHLRNMYKLTGLSCEYFLGIIVFTSDSVDLSNVQCPNACYISNLWGSIKSFGNVLLTYEQVEKICNDLSEANIQSSYYDRKHVKYVKGLQSGKGYTSKKVGKKK